MESSPLLPQAPVSSNSASGVGKFCLCPHCHFGLFCSSFNVEDLPRLHVLIMHSKISACTNKENTQNAGFTVGAPSFDKVYLPQIQVKGNKKPPILAMTTEM